ncbi:uncharacterized protein LOC117191068 [Drosophila miranda]|uniref:uncharacterized protein LOC117191068 n=1 Tax=Drosophila miranda TaxID=7229 RepID=UPI00143FB568|nr:uncharacterized protein LOC117191068 [Drosophila miranda]
MSDPTPTLASELASAVNVSLAQAHATHRAANIDSISRVLQEELRKGFIEMMHQLNEVLQQVRQLQQQKEPQREEVHHEQEYRGAIPKRKPSSTTDAPIPPPKPFLARSGRGGIGPEPSSGVVPTASSERHQRGGHQA